MTTATNANQKIYTDIVARIIKSQEDIIGPLAIQQAQHVDGLRVSWA
jgi:hypothetical protein